MSQRSRQFILPLVLLLLLAFRSIDQKGFPAYPSNWPEPAFDFASHPLDSARIELGRQLFYDPVLSADSTISCASCHLSFTAFTHVDHALSHGINDSIGIRNSPALMNLAWQKAFMWDGAINHLEVQPLAPIQHHAEMGETLENVMIKLNRSDFYRKEFNLAYGINEITTAKMLNALMQFQLTLISSNAKYDQVQRGEAQFTDQEAAGYALFKSNCNSCHQEPLFSDFSFKTNGLAIDTLLNDSGRFAITHKPSDLFAFKVPSLRNIEYSRPYMHDGRFNSLYEVLNHYTNGITDYQNLDDRLKGGIKLDEREKTELVAFLLTLSDKDFVFNPDFGFPRKKRTVDSRD